MLLLCAEVLVPRALWAIFPKATMLSSLELPNSRNLRFGAFSVWLLAMRDGSQCNQDLHRSPPGLQPN